MDDFELEIKRDFLQEAKDLLQSVEQSFLELERDPTNQELINSIFRFAHSLKGTSRAVGFGQIAELTHSAENLLIEIKNGKIHVTQAIVSILLTFNDKVSEMIEGLVDNLDAVFNVNELVFELERISNNEPPLGGSIAVPSVEAFPVDPAVLMTPPPSDDSKWEEEEAAVIDPQPLTATAPVVDELEVPVPPPAQAAPPAMEKAAPIKKERKDDETLRVSLNRLEKLNDLVGELVILKALVENSLDSMGEHKTSRSLGKLCKEIQDLSISLRMVPVGPTFQKMTRVVRDTSALLEKKVELRVIGEDTEIDKTVLESLGDPLVHIIRNAIDHGVETPQERTAAGKAEAGVVELMAFHEGNFLVIQITDDGKGIDANRLIEKAKKKRIIAESANLTEQQGIELIFHPGFSTKDQVSEVSGRGVGMDVVKTNIEALGGEVKVRSRVGGGSCFRLMLPLTLAIIEGMLIQTGADNYVIPKGQVQEIIKLNEKDITRITGRVPYITLRNEIIPLFYLQGDFGNVKRPEANVAVIVTQGDVTYAVGITDVLRQLQVVVKPATKEMAGQTGVMGTTILGNGKPAIIIDLLNLYMKRVKKEATGLKSAAA